MLPKITDEEQNSRYNNDSPYIPLSPSIIAQSHSIADTTYQSGAQIYTSGDTTVVLIRLSPISSIRPDRPIVLPLSSQR